MSDTISEWATLDQLLGITVEDSNTIGDISFAFYGRCSTEDNQDPETSYAWQYGNGEKFTPGTIVTSYFDVGQSRSVPWHRRTEAGRLLTDMKNPKRGWTAVVVGEGTRCWFGNQFSLVAPLFRNYGVEIWVPELGGRYDPFNPSHNMLMSMLGGMSESERQHVQKRTRAGMDAQVLNEGRHQGGRAPYGYVTVDGPPHPNPSRAAAGLRLRILVIDEPAAEVVRRIFREYLQDRGDRAIAAGLNRDGIPCPSAHHPGQNSHRSGDGWQASTVRAILENPRYTGYAVFGRWSKHEELLDPDDVAAGHVVRFKRANQDRIVRSRRPAHPAIVSVETFTQAYLTRRRKAAGGNQGQARLERTRTTTSSNRWYPLRGCIRCDLCSRKMEATAKGGHIYYRCRIRSLVPNSPVLATHPTTVNLRQTALLGPLNIWIGTLFDHEHRADTIAQLIDAQDVVDYEQQRQATRQRLSDAETKLRRHQAAIEAGVDAGALVDAINSAHMDRAVAQAELDTIPNLQPIEADELERMVDGLGDIGEVLSMGSPADQTALYQALQLEIRYNPEQKRATVSVQGPVVNVCVRRGT
ncbi:recombinase family protein [Nocardia bovistercoris]|uniref:Recombinase family protein n=1 Tax=Nocardia bovistercoris TaxID=2785916 RepID=A0A931IGL0_9NOCA|nr:recombinase family protein [Nocardia bovistercoris]MBH0779380.1 recombinase family protein [Nocardia bovistercoris]